MIAWSVRSCDRSTALVMRFVESCIRVGGRAKLYIWRSNPQVWKTNVPEAEGPSVLICDSKKRHQNEVQS